MTRKCPFHVLLEYNPPMPVHPPLLLGMAEQQTQQWYQDQRAAAMKQVVEDGLVAVWGLDGMPNGSEMAIH